jgi:hypothetical protein
MSIIQEASNCEHQWVSQDYHHFIKNFSEVLMHKRISSTIQQNFKAKGGLKIIISECSTCKTNRMEIHEQ